MKPEESRFSDGAKRIVLGIILLLIGGIAMAAGAGGGESGGVALGAILFSLAAGCLVSGWFSRLCRKFDLRLMEIRDAIKAPTDASASGHSVENGADH